MEVGGDRMVSVQSAWSEIQSWSFSDSKVLNYRREPDVFTVRMRMWNEVSLTLVFCQVLVVEDRSAEAVDRIARLPVEGLRLRALCDDEIAAKHEELWEFQFIDADARVVMRVVCSR